MRKVQALFGLEPRKLKYCFWMTSDGPPKWFHGTTFYTRARGATCTLTSPQIVLRQRFGIWRWYADLRHKQAPLSVCEERCHRRKGDRNDERALEGLFLQLPNPSRKENGHCSVFNVFLPSYFGWILARSVEIELNHPGVSRFDTQMTFCFPEHYMQ